MPESISFDVQSRDRSALALDWGPLVTTTLLSACATRNLPDWAVMWLMTGSLYGGFKWLTWRQSIRHLSPSRSTRRRSLAYLCLWPGMDAARFMADATTDRGPLSREWLRATCNILTGAALVWLVAGRFIPWHPLLAGWVGLIGIGLLLLFGLLHLLSLAWRRAGVDAPPVMQRPAAATSLSDFWGRRWNTAFRDLAYRIVFRPLARRWGARRAMAAVFLFSGVLHDLAISIPARAGYGLPTLYFVLQAIGVDFERSSIGRRWHLRGGLIGWMYAAALILAPAALLFHAPFLRRVVVPFLNAMGA